MKKKALTLGAFCALCFAFATAQTARAELIGHWPMDETTGDVATESVNNRNAIWQNPGTNLGWLPKRGHEKMTWG